MRIALDHVVVAARTLEEGGAWVEARLGVAPVAGGKHPLMGTHNRLLRLGPLEYLEVIAIDPQAPPPGRPRWFALDTPWMRERLEAGPALIHRVERTDDIERDVREDPSLGEAIAASRGAYRWRISIPADGSLPGSGRATRIQWEGREHPARALPESGCELLGLATDPLRITVRSPLGIVVLA